MTWDDNSVDKNKFSYADWWLIKKIGYAEKDMNESNEGRFEVQPTREFGPKDIGTEKQN